MKKRLEELNRISKEEYKSSSKLPLVVVLDNIRSRHNTGSVFRTCDAFRISAVYLCGITDCPPNKEIEKTALGATDSVEWKYYENTVNAIKELKNKNYLIAGIEQSHNSIDISDFDIENLAQPVAIILGNEVFGMSDEVLPLCDFMIELPQHGTKHSLNVSVCAGIVIWDMYRRMISTYQYF
ncbi:MAG: RNA methyltransferase [Marinilabiliales bacterium]|nr:MAG: RNA methyltransferase [Marinilabiliales bacterium]